MGTTLVLVLAVGLWLDERFTSQLPPWVPPYPCWLAFAIIVLVACCYELTELLARRGIRLSRPISYAGVLAVALSNWAPWWTGTTGASIGERLAWPFAVACAAGMLMLTREAILYRQPGEAVIAAAGGLVVLFYLGMLGSCLIELRWLASGWLALATLVAAAKCGDTGAYFGGRALGRHKLCPALSPNKTVEGAVAGAVASVVGVWLIGLIGKNLMGVAALPWWDAVLFGATVGPLAQIGDLVESLIKRDCQQKDASNVLPGFGGAMDVLDSLVYGAPLGLLLWGWIGPGWGAGL
jgi:phosphatidate cytidylyltransferase